MARSFPVNGRTQEKSHSLFEPHIPISVFTNDPRGRAFLDDSKRFLEESVVIVTSATEVDPCRC